MGLRHAQTIDQQHGQACPPPLPTRARGVEVGEGGGRRRHSATLVMGALIIAHDAPQAAIGVLQGPESRHTMQEIQAQCMRPRHTMHETQAHDARDPGTQCKRSRHIVQEIQTHNARDPDEQINKEMLVE